MYSIEKTDEISRRFSWGMTGGVIYVLYCGKEHRLAW